MAVNMERADGDNRDFGYTKLPNGLEAVVISNVECDKAAACAVVHAGCIFDPPDICGLAHLTEHVVGLGSVKYPDGLKGYLPSSGGMYNARTYLDYTSYHFDISPKYLSEGLDRLAQQLISPAFDDVLEQVNVVHGEFLYMQQGDGFRRGFIRTQMMEPNWPLKFGLGNLESLLLKPEEKGLDVEKELKDFVEKRYSSNIMSVCVIGRESVEELIALVTKCFSEVRNKELSVPWGSELLPYSCDGLKPGNQKAVFGSITYMVPVADIPKMVFKFPCRHSHDWKDQDGRLLRYMLEQTGKGSIMDTLKKLGFAIHVDCGQGSSQADRYVILAGGMDFDLNVFLTSDGVDNLDRVGEVIFAYLGLLRSGGASLEFFKMVQHLYAQKFRSRASVSPYVEVDEVAVRLLQGSCPIEKLLSVDRKFWEFCPEKFKLMLDEFFLPEKVILEVCAKKFSEKCTETEYYCGTKYSKFTPISAEWVKIWQKPRSNFDLFIPIDNDYIAEKMEIKELDGPEKLPELCVSNEMCSIYHRQAPTYKVPKVSARYIFHLDFIRKSCRNSAITSL